VYPKNIVKFGALAFFCLFSLTGLFAQVETSGQVFNRGALPAEFDLSTSLEGGFSKSLGHLLQIGNATSRVDLVKEGGLDTLQEYARLSVTATIASDHDLAFIYRPLRFGTTTRVGSANVIQVDDIRFQTDSPLDILYAQDVLSLAYRYRFINNPKVTFGFGLGMQLMNFEAQFDGFGDLEGGTPADLNPVRAVQKDLGFLPVLSLAGRWNMGRGFFMEYGLDGFFAPFKYLNMRTEDISVWFYDAGFKLGTKFQWGTELFFGLRAFGQSTTGTYSARQFWTQSNNTPRYIYDVFHNTAFTFGLNLN
jgi:hypothetical protein